MSTPSRGCAEITAGVVYFKIVAGPFKLLKSKPGAPLTGRFPNKSILRELHCSRRLPHYTIRSPRPGLLRLLYPARFILPPKPFFALQCSSHHALRSLHLTVITVQFFAS